MQKDFITFKADVTQKLDDISKAIGSKTIILDTNYNLQETPGMSLENPELPNYQVNLYQPVGGPDLELVGRPDNLLDDLIESDDLIKPVSRPDLHRPVGASAPDDELKDMFKDEINFGLRSITKIFSKEELIEKTISGKRNKERLDEHRILHVKDQIKECYNASNKDIEQIMKGVALKLKNYRRRLKNNLL